MVNKSPLPIGESWQQKRYHNLVRLGGDVLRSGLGEHHKATVLGGLVWYSRLPVKQIKFHDAEVLQSCL